MNEYSFRFLGNDCDFFVRLRQKKTTVTRNLQRKVCLRRNLQRKCVFTS
jgi:hypothetical protein